MLALLPRGASNPRRACATFVPMLNDLSRVAPPVDGRQSERALAVQRGVGRLLRARGFAVVAELPLATG
ncbi:MmcB family DNA repair protein, partial [Bauldia litoralis]|uniref:MmcB family DNA repair protein n=1 Tax=Bauldia litoralis TaxID=665467 RepID=UPI00329976D1